jgi:hypothetical protein
VYVFFEKEVPIDSSIIYSLIDRGSAEAAIPLVLQEGVSLRTDHGWMYMAIESPPHCKLQGNTGIISM